MIERLNSGAGATPPTSARRELLDALVAAGHERRLTRGDVLCREDDLSDEAYVIVSGEVAATVTGYAGQMVVATHSEGALIGEVTTLVGGRRTASLVAAGETTVVAVDRDAVRRIFDEHPEGAQPILREARERTDRSRVAALLSDELQDRDGRSVAAIAEVVTWESIAAGETLFEKGDIADAAYLVVSGRLGVVDVASRPDGHAATTGGRTGRIVEVGRGGIVGEFGLLEDRVRGATVIALRDTALARLDSRDFAALTQDHTSLAMGLVRRILDRAGVETVTSRSDRSFALAITADISDADVSKLTATMIAALERCGPTAHLSQRSVDELLHHDGIADTPSGGFGEIRLAELMHQAETESDHVVLDIGTDALKSRSPNWTDRALHHADQVLLMCSPDPGRAEAKVIERLLDAVPQGIPCWTALLHPADVERPTGAARMRSRFAVDEVHHLRSGHDSDVERLARLAAGRGVGLVLSGGGARGHAHIGVWRSLQELGVPVDRVIGASMGSIVAGAIGQDLPPAEMRASMKNGADDLLDYTLPLVSLVKGERITSVLDGHFDGWTVGDTWIPFACVSTDLTTAEIVVHRTGPVARAIRTSVAIPGVLPPVSTDGHLLADGGILDNLPAGVLGADPSIGVIIASDVAPPVGPIARDDHGLAVSGWKVAASRIMPRWLVRRPPQRYPGLGTTLLRSVLIGSSRSRDEHVAAGFIDLHLELDLRNIPLLEFSMVGPAADAGYEQSRPKIADWLAARDGSPWSDAADPSDDSALSRDEEG